MRIHSPIITGSAENTNIVTTTRITSLTALSSSFASTASFVQNAQSASFAITASHLLGQSPTSSYALTASFIQTAQTASYVLNAQSASYVISSSNDAAQNTRLSTIESVTGSYATTSSFGTYTASNDLTNATQSSRLSTIESVTGSFATTSSNVFKASQTITGSLTITQNLTVLGSSSITYITSSNLNIATNLVTVNTDSPSIRFGGFAVIDSGSSPQRSGSLLFDSINDQWVFVHQSNADTTSSLLIMGPETYNNLGSETNLTNNRIVKSVNAEHIGDSNISDTGTIVSINSNTEITGSLISTGGFTGSLVGTSSYAAQALSASFASTASYISGSVAGFPFSGSAIITGSLFVSGSTISGSFVGNGAGITGLTAGGKIHTQTSAASTWTVSHNLGVQYPNVTVYNSSNEIIIPQTIVATDANILTLTFGSAVAGYAVAGIGGIINVQGRTTQQYFTASTTWSFAHNLGDKYVSLQAFDDAFEMMIPTTIRLVDFTSSLLLFDSASSGYAVATIGGDLPAISSSYAGYTLQVASSAPYSASWVAIPNVTVTNAVSSSFAATASSADNLTVRGTLTAQTINVQTITSSIEFITGSTRNGSLSTNTHQFTGSVLMSGSLGIGTSSPLFTLYSQLTVKSSTAGGVVIQAGATDYSRLFFAKDDTSNVEGVLRYYHNDNSMQFFTSGSEKMRITSAGTLMVGASSNNTSSDISTIAQLIAPRGTITYPLTLSTAGAGVANDQIRITFNYGTGFSATAYMGSFLESFSTAATSLVFGTYGASFAERMRITSAGNVGIGTSSPSFALDVDGNGGNAYIRANTSGSSNWSTLLLQNGDGSWHLTNDNTGTFNIGTGNDPSDLQKITITSAGNVGIGTSSPGTKLHIANGDVQIQNANQNVSDFSQAQSLVFSQESGAYGAGIKAIREAWSSMPFALTFLTNSVAGGYTEKMRINSVGSVGAGGSTTNIYNASDIRLKKNINTITYGLNTVSALNPVKFNWADGFDLIEADKTLLGFIAQEVQTVIPEAVESFGSNVDLNGTTIENTLRVNEKFIIPVLVKAIQELSAKNTTLEERLTALENK